MTALARVLSNLSGVDIDTETLTMLLIVSGAGLLISLVCAMGYGLDLTGDIF